MALALVLGWLTVGPKLTAPALAADSGVQANPPDQGGAARQPGPPAPAAAPGNAPAQATPPAQQAQPAQTAAPADTSDPNLPPDIGGDQVESDPLEPFNSAMFTFNLKLDDWVLHPVASGYAFVLPQPGREAVGRFLDNVRVIPRFANNAFQLRFPEAGTEVARFGINTTVGLVGLFDPADKWFGLKEHPDDFGLTMRYYHVPTGPYLMLPFFGPATIGDAIGMGVDGLMDPVEWIFPWYISLAEGGGQRVAEAVNYRSLHLNQFEEADRYAIDLYGAVQDAYLQTRTSRVQELKNGE
jgi:phospholipid-binding lipoprotein MlaA